MADRFASHPTGLDTPIEDMVAATTGVDFERGESRAIWANAAVVVTLVLKSKRQIADVGLQAGSNPIRAIRVVAKADSTAVFACY